MDPFVKLLAGRARPILLASGRPDLHLGPVMDVVVMLGRWSRS
jgi:hypothetical protein